MRIESATDAKNHFGKVLDAALREPVVIQRSGRNSVIMLAYEEYEELIAISDKYWGEVAQKAESKGFVGTSESAALIDELIHVRD